MKKLLFIAAAIFLIPFIGMKGTPAGNPAASPSRAASAPTKSSGQSGYISPTPGHFPIIALYPTNSSEPSRAIFDQVMECGFNCAIESFRSELFVKLLKEMQDVDSFSFIRDRAYYFDKHTTDYNIGDIQNVYKDMDRQSIPRRLIGGFRVVDEPKYDWISKVKEHHDAISAADTSAMPIVNMVGTYTQEIDSADLPNNKATELSDRRERLSHFLKKFYEEVHPRVWSYDFYPFAYYESSDSVETRLDHFYYALALFAGLSKQTGIPFWAYCQSTRDSLVDKSKPGKFGGHPEATEKRLRFEAFNALAMGAKGICYWRYAQGNNKIDSKNEEYYLESLTDRNDRRMRGWNAARKVNSEIKRHEQLFLRTELQSYSFMGDTGYVKPAEAAGIPKYDGYIYIRASSGPGILVSSLKDGEHFVTFIVNQSATDSATFTMSHPFEVTRILMVENEHADSIRGLISYVDPLNKADPLSNGFIHPTFPYPNVAYYISSVPWFVRLAPSGYMIIEYDFNPDGFDDNDSTACLSKESKPDAIRLNLKRYLCSSRRPAIQHDYGRDNLQFAFTNNLKNIKI